MQAGTLPASYRGGRVAGGGEAGEPGSQVPNGGSTGGNKEAARRSLLLLPKNSIHHPSREEMRGMPLLSSPPWKGR